MCVWLSVSLCFPVCVGLGVCVCACEFLDVSVCLSLCVTVRLCLSPYVSLCGHYVDLTDTDRPHRINNSYTSRKSAYMPLQAHTETKNTL